MEGLVEGRIVHYVDEMPDDYNSHNHLPAIVQYVYQTGPVGHAHLHVKEPGTWHWIEKA